jgi:hypothetical protein
MKPSDRYMKIVEWSDEDQCYVGTCPGLMLGGVHGNDEVAVYKELCEAAEEWIRIHEGGGDPLTSPHCRQRVLKQDRTQGGTGTGPARNARTQEP